MSKEKKIHGSVYLEEAFNDEIKLLILQKKKWKSFNEFALEALREKVKKESKK